jgi:hypothetical protein
VLAGTSRISLTASLGEKWPRRQSYP